jgi:hypothetical protein
MVVMEHEYTLSTLNDPNELADRYVGLWNEPNADLRGSTIRELWTEDGVHILQPPEEVRKAAAGLALDAVFEARGSDALEARVARAYDEFIAPGVFEFRRRPNVARLHNVVKFNWEMVRKSDGEVAGVGLEFLILDDNGRIRSDYQFIES